MVEKSYGILLHVNMQTEAQVEMLISRAAAVFSEGISYNQ